jgi:transposase
LDGVVGTVPPKSLVGKALGYLENQWPKLVRYLDDGRLRMDTNLVENAIRPFVIGRKEWLFSKNVHGTEASANLYGLIETAKMNGLEPYAYLRRVFEKLPAAESVEAFEALLPWRIEMPELTATRN